MTFKEPYFEKVSTRAFHVIISIACGNGLWEWGQYDTSPENLKRLREIILSMGMDGLMMWKGCGEKLSQEIWDWATEGTEQATTYTWDEEDMLAALLKAMGALSNPYVLNGMDLSDEEREELKGFIGYRTVLEEGGITFKCEPVDETKEALRDLLLLVDHETNLPEGAANGVTGPSGHLDEGVIRASEIILAARDLVE